MGILILQIKIHYINFCKVVTWIVKHEFSLGTIRMMNFEKEVRKQPLRKMTTVKTIQLFLIF